MHYLADIILNLKKVPMTTQQKKSLRDFRCALYPFMQGVVLLSPRRCNRVYHDAYLLRITLKGCRLL